MDRDVPTTLNPRLDDVLRETASALWAEGYDRLSVETLARRAGVSRSTVYRHWADKQALVVAAVSDFLQRELPLPSPGPGVDAIGELRQVAGHAGRLAGRPDTARVLLDVQRKAARDVAFAAAWAETVVEPRRQAVVRLLRAAVTSGDVRADLDVDVAADALVGGLYYRLLVQSRPLDEHFGEVLVATVVAGFDHVRERFSDLFEPVAERAS